MSGRVAENQSSHDLYDSTCFYVYRIYRQLGREVMCHTIVFFFLRKYLRLAKDLINTITQQAIVDKLLNPKSGPAYAHTPT